MTSPDGAGLPAALFVSLLLLLGVGVVGVAAGPEVVSGRPTSPQVPADPPRDELSNEVVLRDALGDGYEVSGDEVVAERLEGLPIDLSASATVSVIPAPASSFVCAPTEGPDAGPGACRTVTVSDREVEVVASEAAHSAAGSNFGALMVRYVRPDGHLAVVQLSVLGKPAGGSSSALEDEVRAWLEAREEALIAAATDERLRPAT